VILAGDGDELAALPAAEIRRRVAAREVSPVAVAEAVAARIDRLDPVLNAIVTRSPRFLDDARELESALASGAEPGPLCGVPVGIKDVTPVAGLRHTYGSLLYADHVAEVDALVVRRLRAAGALIVGKTNTPEFAAGGHTFNEVFGPTRNPWDPRLSPGGSTGGGAAALAAGMIALAEGTDLGGSLRIPASFCGVVGLRPTAGLVPTWPSDYLWDELQVTGFLARTAEDVAMALQACAGPSELSPIGLGLGGRDLIAAVRTASAAGLRIAYCPDVAGIGVDPEIEAVCRRAAFALRDAGAAVEEIALDLSWAWQPYLALRGYWMVAQMHRRLDRLAELGPNVRTNTEAGLANIAADLGAAEAARGRVWETFRDLFGRFEHLLTPCMAVPPFPVEQSYPESIGGRKMSTYVDWIAPTFLLSLTGLPVAAVPAGLDPRGLPVGLQIVARPRAEEAALALAAVIQAASGVGLPNTDSFAVLGRR
jgi:amidase